MKTLGDLLASIPHPNRNLKIDDGRFEYVDQSYEKFVDPSFLTDKPFSADETSLILVSAPAAVGKTTLAREVAYRSGAPIWDLAGEQVGTDSLTGALLKTFGHDNASEVFSALETDDLALILDSLDETALLSGFANFEAFLDDVCQYAREPAEEPSVVLFTRRGMADLVEVKLLEEEVPYAHFKLDYFTHEKAVEFVEVALEAKQRIGTPYKRARDQLFSLIYDLLGAEDEQDAWDQPEVRSFLGYAPVLEAVSEYLNDDNPARLVPALAEAREALHRGGEYQEGSWELLLEIVESILKREHTKKFGPAVRGRLEEQAERIGWSNWKAVYQPDEQCQRVLASEFDRAQPKLPDSLPQALRSDYEDVVEEWLPNHPFVSEEDGFTNVVFRDFVLAKGLMQYTTYQEACRQRIRMPEYLPTPLLGRFLLSFAEPGESGRPLIESGDVGFLYESLSSQADNEEDVQLAVWSEGDEVRASFESRREASGDRLEVDIKSSEEPLWLWRSLSYSDISYPGVIHAGVDGETFHIGPDVLVCCDSLAWLSSEIAINAQSERDVEIETDRMQNPVSGPPDLRHFGKGALAVVTSNPVHPWANYIVDELSETSPDTEARRDAFRLFRRALLKFRSEGYGTIARRREVLDNIVFGNSPQGQDLLRFLVDEGILEARGKRYYLRREALGQHGINWAEVEAGEVGEGVKKLIDNFVQQSRA